MLDRLQTTELGFHVRATGEQEKEPFLELDLMTVRPLLAPALSCGYERTKPAKGHSVRPYLHVCKRLCKGNFARVCVRSERVFGKTCENYRSASDNLVRNNTEQLRIM